MTIKTETIVFIWTKHSPMQMYVNTRCVKRLIQLVIKWKNKKLLHSACVGDYNVNRKIFNAHYAAMDRVAPDAALVQRCTVLPRTAWTRIYACIQLGLLPFWRACEWARRWRLVTARPCSPRCSCSRSWLSTSPRRSRSPSPLCSPVSPPASLRRPVLTLLTVTVSNYDTLAATQRQRPCREPKRLFSPAAATRVNVNNNPALLAKSYSARDWEMSISEEIFGCWNKTLESSGCLLAPLWFGADRFYVNVFFSLLLRLLVCCDASRAAPLARLSCHLAE